MNFERIVFVQIDKFNNNNFNISVCVAKRLNSELSVFLFNINDHIVNEIESQLKGSGIKYTIKKFKTVAELEESIDNVRPDIIMLTEEKINPLKHIFTHTKTEKILKYMEDYNLILLQENESDIQKAVIDISDTSTKYYIQNSYEFVKKIVGEVTFIYAFFEDAYQLSIKRTHTEEEAQDIMKVIFEEKKKEIIRKIEEAINGKEYKLLSFEGDPKKEIGYFAKEKGFNFLIIDNKIKDKQNFIENLQISLGIFLDEEID